MSIVEYGRTQYGCLKNIACVFLVIILLFIISVFGDEETLGGEDHGAN